MISLIHQLHKFYLMSIQLFLNMLLHKGSHISALIKKNDAEIAANLLALAHGDIGISNPSDGGITYVATTPDGLKPY